MLIYDQFGIIQNLETSFTVQASFWLVSRVFSLNRLNCEVVGRKICKFDSIEALALFCGDPFLLRTNSLSREG